MDQYARARAILVKIKSFSNGRTVVEDFELLHLKVAEILTC